MWFICRAIETLAFQISVRYGSTPRTYAETMREYNWWAPAGLKNPYTGAPIREVGAPSRGDFTFVGLLDPRPGATGYSSTFIICYDGSGNPVYTDPIIEHVIASYQEIQQRMPPEARMLDNLPTGVTFKKKPR